MKNTANEPAFFFMLTLISALTFYLGVESKGDWAVLIGFVGVAINGFFFARMTLIYLKPE